MQMQIRKRDGRLQALDISKIVYRIDRLIQGTDDQGNRIGDKLSVDANSIALEVCQHVKDGIKSTELDEITAEICAYKLLDNPEYNELAKRLVISNNHKNSRDYASIRDLTRALNRHGRFSRTYVDLVDAYGDQLDKAIDFTRDYLYLDYFGFKTLERNYLVKTTDTDGARFSERPQHMWMRVALEIHRHDLDQVRLVYHRLSEFYYTHATPTLFNSGHEYNALSSCFLAGIPDSIEGMYETARRFALISKNAGGIGGWISDIRGNNAPINSSGGRGSGIVPYIRTLNETARHVDQGSKRKGSFALYLEPWHPDIFDFLELRKNTGSEELRARDIFTALSIPDLFMSRVKQAILEKTSGSERKVMWSLMCPMQTPGLTDCYGEEFERLYTRYERAEQYVRQVDVLSVWDAILDAQMETSLPYMTYKDHINRKSNQQNLGVIKSSNLCVEIMQYSSYEEYSSCNLASICLPKFVDPGKPHGYDLQKLADITGEVTRNLNQVIDRGYTPLPQIKRSNLKHRPIGIGVQGLADVFFKLALPYESPEAQRLNRLISEAMYYGAVRTSVELAAERQRELAKLNALPPEQRRQLVTLVGQLDLTENNLRDYDRQNITRPTEAEIKYRDGLQESVTAARNEIDALLASCGLDANCGNLYELQYLDPSVPVERWGSYSSFEGSPASRGQLQFDMWGQSPSGEFDWDSVRQRLARYGMRNSLLIAFMPTASTAQIMGNNECFEPITSNIYSRSVLSGNFVIVNKYLQRDLRELGLWNRQMKEQILRERGSIQNIESIPANLKQIYKTSWEISKKTYLKMSADRSAFIDQSQSLNLFIEDPTYNLLTTIHLYGWELGLKTGMYYLRRKTVANAQQFSVGPTAIGKAGGKHRNPNVPTENTDEVCVNCSA